MQKGTGQLHCNYTADQCFCFCYIDSTLSLSPKSQISTILCGITARFVSDPGNAKTGFLAMQLTSLQYQPVQQSKALPKEQELLQTMECCQHDSWNCNHSQDTVQPAVNINRHL